MNSDERSRRRRTVYGAVGVAALVGAAGTTVLAVVDGPSERPPTLWVRDESAEPRPQPTADTAGTAADVAVARPDVTAAAHPSSTVPSVAVAPADPSIAPPPSPTSPDTAVPSTSAVTPPTAPRTDPTTTTTLPPPSPPVRIVSSRIDIDDFPIRPVGLEEDGRLEIPGAGEIGWYELGSSPQRPGVTVLAAHVSWNGSIGPFAYIADLRVGDVLDVVTLDGRAASYRVSSVRMHAKADLSQEDLWRRVGPEQLALITCGGEFDDEINRYRDNIVVIAEPIPV